MSMTDRPKRFAKRDIQQLNAAGNLHTLNVQAMAIERLFDRSDIAAELAYRDMLIAQQLEQLAQGNSRERALEEIVERQRAALLQGEQLFKGLAGAL